MWEHCSAGMLNAVNIPSCLVISIVATRPRCKVCSFTSSRCESTTATANFVRSGHSGVYCHRVGSFDPRVHGAKNCIKQLCILDKAGCDWDTNTSVLGAHLCPRAELCPCNFKSRANQPLDWQTSGQKAVTKSGARHGALSIGTQYHLKFQWLDFPV